jgi:DNA-directed DNA polymerase III PolC
MYFASTYYSLRYGTLSPNDLVEAAKARGIKTLALTEINNTSCSFQFIKLCKAAGIKPVLGIEFRRENEFLYTGIAKNEEGFFELNQFLTKHSVEDKPLPDIPPDFKNVYLIYRKLVKGVKDLFDYEFIGIRPEELNSLYSSPLRHFQHKLIAFNRVVFLDEEGFRTHKLLRAIDLNIIVTKLCPDDYAKATSVFSTPLEIEKNYERYPKILNNAKHLFDTCFIDLESGLGNNRQTFTGSKEADFKLLKKLCYKGYEHRYGNRRDVFARIEKELDVIYQLNFECYFLITWDIIRYAHSVGYHHIGRGSGANSIVAYCLRITDVEPIELDLYFERFINQFRTSPPDFDIDFSWDERDDVTDYIFKRYGATHTALLATYNTFKGKSIIREVGKAFGLPKAEIDLLVDEPLATEKHHGYAKHVFKYGERIVGFPNYLSIHAGGVLISEKPINYFTALQLMPKGFPITHFDMYGAEDLGFHKYDILSQRGLGHIKDAVTLIHQNKKERVDIHDLDTIKQDEKVKAQLRSGHCIGCFYIESPAMRGLLSKLRCDNYIHLVAASSIIRPGVSKSGMMREYIQRFHHPHSFKYLHPVFEENLGETFGVMVYQEDVMKIVHHFAGLDLDESDVLRRIMTGKRKSSDSFERLRKKYFENCKKRGYTDELTKEVWRQVESFSGYSFCKAHSASFAAESFQSLYLKAYHPLEFMVAVINNFGGFYKTEYYFHEARMQGANIHPPCVNHSLYLTTIIGKDIYIGFIHLHQMERKTAHKVIENRQQQGRFKNLEDFTRRVAISSEQLDILIRIGAFRFTGKTRYQLMWHKNEVFNPTVIRHQTGFLFDDETEDYELPILEKGRFDDAFDQIELLGFPLCAPFDLLVDEIKGDVSASQMLEYDGRTVRMLGYYVTRKQVTTVNKKHMSFGTWLDKEGRFFDTTHFPPSLRRHPFRGKGCYLIIGKVVLDFGFPSIEVTKMERLAFVKDERY